MPAYDDYSMRPHVHTYTQHEYHLLQERNLALSEQNAALLAENRKLKDDLEQLTSAVTDEIAKRLATPVPHISLLVFDDPNNLQLD